MHKYEISNDNSPAFLIKNYMIKTEKNAKGQKNVYADVVVRIGVYHDENLSERFGQLIP